MKTFDVEQVRQKLKNYFGNLSAESLEWASVLILHAATLPSLLAVMAGVTDKLPSVDLVLMLWFGLALLFTKAAVRKDMLNIVTIGFGFMLQAAMLALIFFK
ncbi:MAG: hypothetical protein ACO3EG_08325 [Chitinophagaceae bacterium]